MFCLGTHILEAIVLCSFTQKEKLKTFEDDFLDKVKAVEISYRDRMDALMTENTALRRRWLEKTDQFSRYQSDIEKSRAQTIRNFKDTVSVT
jgi:aminoglycoside N3'-acetyltransferase